MLYTVHDHFYFLFEAFWLATYKLEFHTTTRTDAWLKFSEKALFPTPHQISSFLVWFADCLSNHLFTDYAAIWEHWLFSPRVSVLNTHFTQALLFVPTLLLTLGPHWHWKWPRELKLTAEFLLFFIFLLIFGLETFPPFLEGAQICS